MSETINDAPQGPVIFGKKDETQPHSMKEIGFIKKDSHGEDRREMFLNRQKPAFLNRVNSGDMKRSLVLDSNTHTVPIFPMPKRTRKVRVDDFHKIK